MVSHRHNDKSKDDSVDNNRTSDTKKARLLRAAKKYVKDHEDRGRIEDGRTRRKDHHRSRRRSGDWEEDSVGDEKRKGDSGRKRKSRGDDDEKRHRHKSGDKERRRSGDRYRSDDDYDDRNRKHNGRGENDEDSDVHTRRKRSRHPKERKKHKKEKRSGGRYDHRMDHSSGDARTDKRASRHSSNDDSTFEKSALFPIGPIVAAPPKTKIDHEKDYFTFHSHLRLYLYRTSGTYFEDLKGSQTRSAFARFCQLYNEGQLEEAFYDDAAKLPEEAMRQCKRTRHAWNFKTNDTEQKSLGIIKAGVQKQTEYDVKFNQQPRSLSNGSEKKSSIAPRRCIVVKEKMKKDVKEEKIQENAMTKKDEQEAMLKMLGLDKIKTGKKITIAPR